MESRPSRAVIIGIDGEGEDALDGAAREAESFAAFLDLRDIVKTPIKVVTDIDKGKGKRPTRDTIMEMLKWVCTSNDEGSCVLLVYIGSRSASERGIRPLDWEENGDIEESELLDIFRESTQPVISIFDCSPAAQVLTLPHCVPANYSSSDTRGEDLRILHLSTVQTGDQNEEEEQNKGGVLVSGLLTVLRAHGVKPPTNAGLLAAIRVLLADGRWKRAPTLSSCHPVDPALAFNFSFPEDTHQVHQPMETNPTPLAPPPAPPLQGRASFPPARASNPISLNPPLQPMERSRSGSCDTAPMIDAPVKSSPVQRKSLGSASSRGPSSSLSSDRQEPEQEEKQEPESTLVRGLEFSPDTEPQDAPKGFGGWGDRAVSVTPPADPNPPPKKNLKIGKTITEKLKTVPNARVAREKKIVVPPPPAAPTQPVKKLVANTITAAQPKTRKKAVEQASFMHPTTCMLQDSLSPLTVLGPAMTEVYNELLDWVEENIEKNPPGAKLQELLKRRGLEDSEFASTADKKVEAVLGSGPKRLHFKDEMVKKLPDVKESCLVVGTKDAGKSTFVRLAVQEQLLPYVKEFKRYSTVLLTTLHVDSLYPKDHGHVSLPSFYSQLITSITSNYLDDLIRHRPILRQWQAPVYLFWKRVVTGVPSLPKGFSDAFPNIATVWQKEAVVLHTQFASGCYDELVAHVLSLPASAMLKCCGFKSWHCAIDGLQKLSEDHEQGVAIAMSSIASTTGCRVVAALPSSFSKKIPSVSTITMTKLVPTEFLPSFLPTIIKCEGKDFTIDVFGGCPGYLTSYLTLLGMADTSYDLLDDDDDVEDTEKEVELYSPSILKLLNNLEALHCKAGSSRRD